MGTEIGWTDETWNPIVGCSHASPGCDNCYAEKAAASARLQQFGQYQEVILWRSNISGLSYPTKAAAGSCKGHWYGRTVFVESALEKPLHWKAARKIFVCSMSDLFHPSVKFDWVDEIIKIVFACPQHTFQFLTKRPKIMAKYFYDTFVTGKRIPHGLYVDRLKIPDYLIIHASGQPPYRIPPNLWLGTTVEHPDYKYRIDELRQIPATVRFLSFEPLLADLGEVNLEGIGWVIIGAESGAKRRKCEYDWAAELTTQCKQAGVPCFVKQLHGVNRKLIKLPPGFPREFPEAKK